MIIRVSPSLLSGQVNVPSSKSLSARFIAAALLADSPSKLFGLSDCDDTTAALEMAALLGAEIELGKDAILITPCENGIPRPRSESINAGESGLAARMFAPLAALASDKVIMNGTGSLLHRPFSMVSDGLESVGASIKSNNGLLPLEINGPILGGNFTIDGSESSQFLTGLLLALPYAQEDSIITVNNLVSRPYMKMTLEVMTTFGLDYTHTENSSGVDTLHIPANQTASGGEFAIDGDWSAAATLLVLGALCGRPDLEITGIRGDFTQADSGVKGALLFAGYHILGTDNGLSLKKKRPRAFDLDLTNSPDLFPVLAALAVFSNKPSRLRGAHRLTSKESDRASVLISEFAKADIKIDHDPNTDSLLIHPGKPKSARLNSHGDHRIAMAAAILGCAGTANIEIEGAECVAKSYPAFFDDLESIGGLIQEVK